MCRFARPRGTVAGRSASRLALATLGLAVTLALAPGWVWAAAGDLDSSFGSGGLVTTSFVGSTFDYASSLVVQGDGKLVAVGISTATNPSGSFGLARYNPNGSLDPSFGNGGQVTTDFGPMGDRPAVAIQGDGKLVVAGEVVTFPNGNPLIEFVLVRYNPDGSVDSSFGSGGQVTTYVGGLYGGYVNALSVQSDGKLVVAGYRILSGQNEFALARYNSDGSLDPTFGAGRCSASQVFCDGQNLCGPSEICGGAVYTSISGYDDIAYALKIQSDGKLVAAGFSLAAGAGPPVPTYDVALVRYNTDGSLDSEFGSGGVVTTEVGPSTDIAYALSIQSDGKLVVAGSADKIAGDQGFALVRYNTDGSLDSGFGSGGKVLDGASQSAVAYALVVQSDGKLVAAGYSALSFALTRYNNDGSLDSSFGIAGTVETVVGGNPPSTAYALAVQSDGKLVAAGTTGAAVFALARYLSPNCTNGGIATKAKLTAAKLLAPVGDDTLAIKGETVVPTTPTLNPIGSGVRLLLTGATSATLLDVTIPAGAYNAGTKTGWKANGTNTAWTYKGPGTGTQGIQKVGIKLKPPVAGAIKFAVKGKNGTYPVTAVDVPVTATLVLDVPTAPSGQCVEVGFPATPPARPSCALIGGKTLKCK